MATDVVIRPNSIGPDIVVLYQHDVPSAIDGFCRNIGLLCIDLKEKVIERKESDGGSFSLWEFKTGTDRQFYAYEQSEGGR